MNEFVIKLADKRIKITPLHGYLRRMCADYICSDDCNVEAPGERGYVDFAVAANEEDIDFEREKSAREDELEGITPRSFSDGYLETLAVYRRIAEKMPDYDTVLFHGSALCIGFACDDEAARSAGPAVIFTGPSGIGKSTHARLWRENIDGVTTINDDKPLIKIEEDAAFAYGTPWDGKDHLNTNIRAPIKAICVLKQATANRITEMSWSDAFATVLQQTYRPDDIAAMKKTLALIGGLKGAGVKFYQMECNMEPEAALMCHDMIMKQSRLFTIDDEIRFDFPCRIHRVTGGHGGEVLLIEGNEKWAMHDCGMAYCHEATVANAKAITDRIDYVILSHSHYDHIGGLPYIREAYPEAEVLGSAKCAGILEKPSARQLMEKLGLEAMKLYAPDIAEASSSTEPKLIKNDGLKVDRIIGEGDVIDLGDYKIKVFETGGHTDCSLSFLIEPVGLLLASESTGIMENDEYVHTPVLKSFPQAIESARKCQALKPEHICLPHAGMLPEQYVENYFELFLKECYSKRKFVEEMMSRGMSFEEMFAEYCRRYWTPAKAEEQPYEAFAINAGHVMKCLVRWIEAEQ